jgi:hypothetical protein
MSAEDTEAAIGLGNRIADLCDNSGLSLHIQLYALLMITATTARGCDVPLRAVHDDMHKFLNPPPAEGLPENVVVFKKPGES